MGQNALSKMYVASYYYSCNIEVPSYVCMAINLPHIFSLSYCVIR